MLALEFLKAHLVCFLYADNMVPPMLIRQNAINAELKATFVAVGLNGLHIGNMAVAELCDQAKLVDQRLVAVQIKKTCLLRRVAVAFLVVIYAGLFVFQSPQTKSLC